MSDSVQIELIIVVGTVFNTLVSGALRYMSHNEHKENTAKITAVEEQVNGKMSKLLSLTAEAERAKGILEERSRQK